MSAAQRNYEIVNSIAENPIKLLHISDLHFGPPYVPEVGEAALRMASKLKSDAVIISGDLTQRATREQFVSAKQFLDRLPGAPQLVIPGNHDVPLYRIWERMFRPHALYQEIITAELNPVLKIRGAVIAGLDSTAPRSAISNGRIFKRQLDACEQVFRDVPSDYARIVVAHHHFAPAPDHLHDSNMPKAKRAIERFADWKVDMILGGHLHRAYIGNSLDFYPGSHRDKGSSSRNAVQPPRDVDAAANGKRIHSIKLKLGPTRSRLRTMSTSMKAGILNR